jgi:hypothetical protein
MIVLTPGICIIFYGLQYILTYILSVYLYNNFLDEENHVIDVKSLYGLSRK